MANFKVVFRDENIGWQKGCPIIIEAVQVSRNTETAQCFLQTRVKNISNRIIHKISLSIEIMQSGNIESAILDYLDADIEAGREYVPQAKTISSTEIDTITIKVIQVDKSTFEKEPMPIPTADPLNLSVLAAKERNLELSEASVKSECDCKHTNCDNWWQCGCGAINVERRICHECGAPLSKLKDWEEEASLIEKAKHRAIKDARKALLADDVTQLIESEKALKALPEDADAQAIINEIGIKITQIKAANETKKKRNLTIGIVAAILIALLIGGFSVNVLLLEPARQKDAMASQPLDVFNGYVLGDDAGNDSKITYSNTPNSVYASSPINGIQGYVIITKDPKTSKINGVSWVTQVPAASADNARTKVIQGLKNTYGEGSELAVKVGDKDEVGTVFTAKTGIQYLVSPNVNGTISVAQIELP